MRFEEREFLPVILGADITAYSLVRSFYEAYAVKSLVLSKQKAAIIAGSRLCENRIYPRLDSASVLIPRLVAVGREFSGKKKLLLLGCGDWYVRAVVEHKEALSRYYVIPYIDRALLDKIVLKDKFYEICDSLSIDHPKTYIYTCGQNQDLKFDFSYPVIAKPASSAAYHYAEFPGKKKVFRFEDEASLRAMLARLETSGYDYKFLIQEYIPGDDTNMRVLTCYSDRHGRVRFAAAGHVLLEDHTPSAIGNPVAIINERDDRLIAQAVKFLEHIGYTGFSNFDVKVDPRTGAYQFFEINTRLGRSNYYVTGGGFNVAEWMVKDLIEHEELTGTVAGNEHLFYVVPKGIIRRYVQNPELKKQVNRLFRQGQASYPLWKKHDMSPWRSFYVWGAYLNQYRKYHRAEHETETNCILEEADSLLQSRWCRSPKEGAAVSPNDSITYSAADVTHPVAGSTNTLQTATKQGGRKTHNERNRSAVLGVLGGVGPLATVCFMDMVVQMTDASGDQEHIPMVVLNDTTIPDRTDYILDHAKRNPLPAMVRDARRLEAAGCSMIVVPCNTAHCFYDRIQDAVGIPVANIIEETVTYAMQATPGLKRLGILATKGTLAAGSYQKVCARYGIDCVLPAEETAQELMNIIYKGVKAGNPVDTSAFLGIIDEMRSAGSQAVILGCTELSVLHWKNHIRRDDVIDSMEVLARASIQRCGRRVKYMDACAECQHGR